MSPHTFKVGDPVRWRTSVLDLVTRKRRIFPERGAIYRVDAEWIAVLPESWRREGKKLGLLKRPEDITLIVCSQQLKRRAVHIP